MGSTDEDVPRYKKLISKSKGARTFSKKDRERVTAELKAELGDESLEDESDDDESDDDDDEDDDEGTCSSLSY